MSNNCVHFLADGSNIDEVYGFLGYPPEATYESHGYGLSAQGYIVFYPSADSRNQLALHRGEFIVRTDGGDYRVRKDTTQVNINFKKLRANAQMPFHGSEQAAGYDLYVSEVHKAGSLYVYYTGIAVDIPENMFGIITPRSSVYSTGLLKANSVGIVDSDYHGELFVMFREFPYTDEEKGAIADFSMKAFNRKPTSMRPYEVGERCAQLIILPHMYVNFLQGSLKRTVRSSDGYGSTGNL